MIKLTSLEELNNELIAYGNESNSNFDDIKNLVISSRNKVYSTVNTEMLNEILDEILKKGNREEIMQRLNEYLQADEKLLELKKVDTALKQN